MESKNSVPSSHGKLSDTPLDNGDQSSLDENYQKLYGFNFNDTYRHALRFYKENESKQNLNYNDKNRLVAYTQQSLHGPLAEATVAPLGALDVIGRDRRNAWASLGNLKRHEAMQEFITDVVKLMPHLRAYFESLKKEKEDEEKRLEQQQKLDEEKLKQAENAAQIAKQAEMEQQRQEVQRRQIQDALNEKTYSQFRAYAEQQYPNDPDRQAILVRQLQEQHYCQYMQQVYQQQMETQASQAIKEAASSQVISQNTSINVENSNGNQHLNSLQTTSLNHGTNINGVSDSLSNVTISDTKSSPSHNVYQNEDIESCHKTAAATLTSEASDPDYNYQKEQQEVPLDLDEDDDITDDEDNLDDDDEIDEDDINQRVKPVDHDCSEECGFCTDEDIPAASMWTKKELGEFKESIRNEGGDSIIKVGHGETVTVRVPTHSEGNALFWEFATDSYDVAFGLFFEWTDTDEKEISVHVSDSEDEDLDEYEDENGDPETGATAALVDKGPPTSVIIPIYRRDCHEEVYAGTHAYPGKGVYLLKFDNTYSLWRSKTLYYRVYYTK